VKRVLTLLTMFFLFSINVLPGQAAAWKFGNEQQVIEKDQVFTGDFIFQGESLEVSGVIKGDLLVWAKEVTIKGRIEGDLIGVVTNKLIIKGTIGRNSRVIANDFLLSGKLNGNLSGIASYLETKQSSRISGGVLGFFQELTLRGKVAGPVEVTGLIQTKIGGQIEGDIKVKGNPVIWQAPAEFRGKIHDYTGGTNDPRKTKGIKVARDYLLHEQILPEEIVMPQIPIVLLIAWFVGSILLALIFYRLFPGTAWSMTEPSAINFKKNMLVGAISFFLVPLILGTLIIVFGIVGNYFAILLPLIVFLGMGYLFLMFFANLPVYLWLGRIVLKSRFHPIILILSGAFLTIVIALVPLINLFAQLVFTWQGFGMIVRRIKFQAQDIGSLPSGL